LKALKIRFFDDCRFGGRVRVIYCRNVSLDAAWGFRVDTDVGTKRNKYRVASIPSAGR